MKTLYKARFLGQGFSIPFGSIVDIVAERKKDVMISRKGKLINVFGKFFIEKMKKHQLIIKCLNDAQAECSCGHWWYCFTGEKTRQEITEEFKKHLKN